MKSPFTGGVALRKSDLQILSFRSQSFQVFAHFYECVDSGETFTTEALDALNIIQLHNQYRESNHILFPEQIKALREKYGVSQRTMSTILGFGINQYRSYEDGEIPSLSNAKLIGLVRDSRNFRALVTDKAGELREKEYKAILQGIEEILNGDDGGAQDLLPLPWRLDGIPDQYTGYRVPDFNKFAQMVLFYFNKLDHLFTVKLNKLLFYSDFCHYKRTGFSISGCRYRAIPMGPVPEEYRILNDLLISRGYLELSFLVRDEEYIEILRPNPNTLSDLSVFTAEELDTLEMTFKLIGYEKTGEIVTRSHQEIAWKENETTKSRISYQQYGFQLTVDLVGT